MEKYQYMPLNDNVEEMFIGPFGSGLKNDSFVDESNAFCMVYEQKHAIKKTMKLETRYVNREKYEELKRFNIHGGDIIVSCRGTIGETYIVPDDAPLGIMHPSIMKIRLKSGVYNKQYFNLLLRNHLKQHEAEANGSGIKMAISAKELGATLFPVPDMAEQNQIASAFNQVEELISLRKQQLAKLDELVKARFVELFGDPETNPYGWEKVTVGEVCSSIVRGPFGSALKKEFFVEPNETTYKVYEQKHAIQKSATIGTYYVTAEKFDELRRFECVAGDILMSCSGTMGELYQLPEGCEKGLINQALCKFTLNERILPIVFLTYMKQTIGNLETKGSGIQNIAAVSYVKAMPINLAPMEVQEQFATFVEQTDKSKLAIQQSLDKLATLKKSLMQKYFG